MRLAFRPLPVWPHPATPWAERRSSYTFKAPWQRTLDLLGFELEQLEAEAAAIGVGIQESDIRIDGWPKARAQFTHPGVELSFDCRFGRLVYATDTFDSYEANTRALALGLQALRRLDRYGIGQRGEQYAGWKALPATAMAGMGRGEAERILRLYSEQEAWGDPRSMYRAALKRTHPDAGGSAEAFRAVQEAARVLGIAA